VVLDQALVLEPVHPAQDRVGTPTRPDRVREVENQSGDTVGITGGLCVLDGGLGHPVRLAPRRGPEVELRDRVRLSPQELG
jgi:hypothetical protein